jgi:5-methylcytosine-specific restriction endonuclease McrA
VPTIATAAPAVHVTAADARSSPGGSAEPEPPGARSGTPPRALLLNASLEPLCVVSLHRAVALVLAGKATVVESEGRRLRSERVVVPVPVVACLTRYVHVPVRRPVPPTRRTVLQRDGHRCAYCGGGADTVDHVLPRSRGGAHEWGNVVAACGRCNHRKADRLLHEIGWELGFTPRAPRWSVAFGAQAVHAEPAWSRYLVA